MPVSRICALLFAGRGFCALFRRHAAKKDVLRRKTAQGLAPGSAASRSSNRHLSSQGFEVAGCGEIRKRACPALIALSVLSHPGMIPQFQRLCGKGHWAARVCFHVQARNNNGDVLCQERHVFDGGRPSGGAMQVIRQTTPCGWP